MLICSVPSTHGRTERARGSDPQGSPPRAANLLPTASFRRRWLTARLKTRRPTASERSIEADLGHSRRRFYERDELIDARFRRGERCHQANQDAAGRHGGGI
jgi:hypothetical protein